MTELEKKIKEEEDKKAPAGTADLKTLETSLEQEKEDKKKLAEENADLKFSNEFNTQVNTYPLAKEHEEDIKAKVKAGYSVEDAVIAVLQKHNKLKTADQITADKNKGVDLGGSARTPNLNKNSTAEKTAEEYGEELKEFERKGEFRLDSN